MVWARGSPAHNLPLSTPEKDLQGEGGRQKEERKSKQAEHKGVWQSVPGLQREAAPCWAITGGGEAGLEGGSQWGEAALGCVMSSLYSHVQHSSVSHHPAWLAPKCPGFIF